MNGKWWLPGVTESAKFNDHVIKHAQDWVGDYTETYFEVNCLVIDEKNILMLGENEAVFRELERHGITAHSLPFRTRTFWDGGLHCITLDIRRQDTMIDLFPERGDQAFFEY
jgi:glycine amidinotransferase